MSVTVHRNVNHKLKVVIKFYKLLLSADRHLFKVIKKTADQCAEE